MIIHVAEVAAPSKRGPSAFILASLIETELTLPLREDFTLLPLAQASGRYERSSGRKPWSISRLGPDFLVRSSRLDGSQFILYGPLNLGPRKPFIYSIIFATGPRLSGGSLVLLAWLPQQ